MRGISASTSREDQRLYVPVVLDRERYQIQFSSFERTVSDDQLLLFTDKLLECLAEVEAVVLERNDITIDRALGETVRVELARWGSRAYRELFADPDAQSMLEYWLPGSDDASFPPTPTFVSDTMPFPWELLYDGDHYRDAEPESFWGLRLAPARILDRRDLSRQVREQSLPTDMLFCVHHGLRRAHEQEWPELERIVVAGERDRFKVLGAVAGSPDPQDGEALLTYLLDASHTMVHFACHCDPGEDGEDVLEVSVLATGADGQARMIAIDTYAFTDARAGQFLCRPLVFLNACQAAGRPDAIRTVFNLPRKFVLRGAGAVVATACPVPDIFAAAFARRFYELFLRGRPPLTIGEALRRTRREFLELHHNPLGLAYGLYTPAQYRLAQAPAAMGALP